MTSIDVRRPQARVNHGRWVVNCRSPLCESAMTLGPPRMDAEGRVWPGLAIGQDTMTCRDCGFVTVDTGWPPDPRGIELVLAWRPDPATRNWEPGETIGDLLRENVEHGVPIPGVDNLPPGETNLLTEIDGVVVGGYLGELLTQLVGADNRPRIGA